MIAQTARFPKIKPVELQSRRASKSARRTTIAPASKLTSFTRESGRFEPISAEFIDFNPINLLHRNHDGFLVFAVDPVEPIRRGVETVFRQLAIPAASVGPTMLASRHCRRFRRQLGRDSYYSINGFYRHRRQASDVRWLTAAFVDLDCHRVGIDPLQARAEIDMMQREKLLPQVSFYAYSGRGLWAFWRLREEDNPGPVRALYRTDLYKRIQAALARRLVKFGADTGAQDIARITRIPGSINGKADKEVRYSIETTGRGEVATYRIGELADLLGVPLQLDERRPKRRGTQGQPNRRKQAGNPGFTAMMRSRMKKLNALRQHRGGFGEGCRHHALTIYAAMFRACRLSHDKIAEQVTELADDCNPSFPAADAARIASAIAVRPHNLRFSDTKIADLLDVLPDEARATELPPALRFRPATQPKPLKRDEKTAMRRDVLIELERGVGHRQSARATADALANQWTLSGNPPSFRTIASDFRAVPAPKKVGASDMTISRTRNTLDKVGPGPVVGSDGKTYPTDPKKAAVGASDKTISAVRDNVGNSDIETVVRSDGKTYTIPKPDPKKAADKRKNDAAKKAAKAKRLIEEAKAAADADRSI